MPALADLSAALAQNDPMLFLKTYMQMVVDGDNLSVPSSLQKDRVKEGWTDILESLSFPLTDDFLDHISRVWITVVKRQGGTVSPTFAKEVLDILLNRAQPKPPASKQKAPTDIPSAPTTLKNDTVSLHISTDYYKHSVIDAKKPTQKEAIDKNVLADISKNDIEGFLMHFLSYTQINIKPTVPLSTVLGVISDRWEDILMREYGIVPTPAFLTQVSLKWFYWVNVKGIPIDMEKLSALYIELAGKHHAKPKTKKAAPQIQKTKGFFARLFGI